ncbi:MAG: hypothetical protein AAF939_02865 [Planctomycetota bacterium]
MFHRVLIILFCLPAISNWSIIELNAEDSAIEFDVPAIACAHILDWNQSKVTNEQSSVVTYREGLAVASDEKLIEVVIPVSTRLVSQDGGSLQEFRVDVFWVKDAYPLFDYGPKSETTTQFEGTIARELTRESRAGIGVGINGKVEWVAGNLKGDLSERKMTVERFQEIPQHDILISSGSIRRGTGAFFRFHPSRLERIEGGRDVILAFRVPNQWRTGILQVQCRASGQRKVVGSWHDSFQGSKSFSLPIHLTGDTEARDKATGLINAESGLKRAAARQKPETSRGFSFFQPAKSSANSHSNLWVESLIQTGSDPFYEQNQASINPGLKKAAASYLAARDTFLRLGR